MKNCTSYFLPIKVAITPMLHCNVPLCLKYMYQFSIILNYLHPKFIFVEIFFLMGSLMQYL